MSDRTNAANANNGTGQPDYTSLTPHCRGCGGIDVMHDAWAVWDDTVGMWTLGNTFDNSFCGDCDGECTIEWRDKA